MGIFFIISFLALMISIYLLPRKEEKENGVIFFFLSLIVTMSINVFSVFIFNTFHIKSLLIIRSILFLLISFGIILYCYKKRKTQKYYYSKMDILVVVSIFFIVLLIGKMRFGFELNLTFETTDPFVHFFHANEFSDNYFLSGNPTGGNSVSTMFYGYTSVGTLFQVFGEEITTKVNVYILFELLILYLIGVFTYLCAASIKNNIKRISILSDVKYYIFMMILEILLLFGYPLNCLIFGFHYLNIVVMLVAVLILMINLLLRNRDIIYAIFCSIISMSIFFTYYMFIPVIYGGIGLYLLYICFVNKSIDLRTSIKYISIILVVPFIIGMLYFFGGAIFGSSESGGIISSGVNTFKLEGYIYRNLISNFIFIGIIAFYKLIRDIKNKKIDPIDFVFICLLVVLILLTWAFYNDYIVGYYYFKIHYLLFVIMFAMVMSELIDFANEIKTILCIIIMVMFGLFLAQYYQLDEKLYYKNPLFNNSLFVSGLENVYWFNFNRIDKKYFIFNNQELHELEDVIEKYDSKFESGKFLFNADIFQKLWYLSLTYKYAMPDTYDVNKLQTDNPSLNNLDTADYAILYNNYDGEIPKNFELEYANGSFSVYSINHNILKEKKKK